jgi:hypothetical protein
MMFDEALSFHSLLPDLPVGYSIRADDGEVRMYLHGREFIETPMQKIVATDFQVTNVGSVKPVFISEVFLGFPDSVRRFHRIPAKIKLREVTESDSGTRSGLQGFRFGWGNPEVFGGILENYFMEKTFLSDVSVIGWGRYGWMDVLPAERCVGIVEDGGVLSEEKDEKEENERLKNHAVSYGK